MGLTWTALGDSITFGLGASVRSNAYVYQTRKLLQANGKNHTLIDIGISGIRTDELLAKWKGAGGRCDPDLVTIMIGTNDLGQGYTLTQYQTNLTSLINDIKSRKSFGKCYIVLCTPPWRNDVQTVNQTQWNSMIQTVATATDVDFVDTYSAFNNATYLSDTLHPNDSGHQLIANILYAKLNALSVWSNTPSR